MSASSHQAAVHRREQPVAGTLLILTENHGWGGAAVYLRDLVHAVRPLYARVVIASNRGGLTDWDPADPLFDDAGVSWVEYSYTTRREVRDATSRISGKLMIAALFCYDRWGPWFHRRLARRILNVQSPDAVFCANHGAQSLVWPTMALCGERGIPAATYLLGLPDMFSRLPSGAQSRFDRRMWQASRFVIVNARAVAEAMCEQRGLPSSKCVVIPNGIPDQPAPSRRVMPGCVRLGTLSRLTLGKGVHLVIDAVAELRRRQRPVELAVAGEGPEADALQRRAAELGLTQSIHFLGFVPDDGVAEFLSGVDVFVHASSSEGLPYVLIEAMRAQLPIVATAVGGVPEMIEHGRTGFLVQPGDADALADAIDNLTGNAALRHSVGERARRRFEERYTVSVMREAIRQAFVAGDMVPDQMAASDARAFE